jgi:amino acid adenylation domain-containing protein
LGLLYEGQGVEAESMNISDLFLAWGILLTKYHEPDSLQIIIHSDTKEWVWSHGNKRLNADEWICLSIPACMDCSIQAWKELLLQTLEPYHLKRINNLSEELEYIVAQDRKWNEHHHSELQAERFISHLLRIRDMLQSDRPTFIQDLDFMSVEERRQLIVDFNQTNKPYPKDTSIHERFREHAARASECIAVVSHTSSITYGELDRKSDQLAARLRLMGAKQGGIVAITADRTIEMVIGLLAILKTGAAYLPIDVRSPEAYNRMILAEAGSRIAVTRALPGASDLALLDPYDPMSYEATENGCWRGCSSDLAYVIFTSGTTGIPKGVLIKHQGVINFAAWFHAKYDLQKHPHMLQSANLTFDASVESIFCPLLHGGTVILIRSELLLHKQAFRRFIDRHQIHIAPLVPSLLPLLTDDEKLESLKIVISGGEVLEQELKDQILDKGYMLYNHYGPTETTVVALASEMGERKVTLGKPIDNTSVYILKRNLELCPIGIFGEICISGDGLASGYLNRSELTRERFVPNPYKPGQLMYRTGDIGRWLDDGNVEYAGRTDDQLKLNGVIVHPESVRRQLLSHDAVIDACIIVATIHGMKKLYAYYIPKSNVRASELREYLLRQMPAAAVPSKFVEVPSFPLNLSGKLNKQQLLSLLALESDDIQDDE